ncbi:DEAD/DEAH box helicase [Promicromonospora sp. NPDC057488]|uniref:DEAD/DEAH box helicase n=1 Tax=Promicromonospora sp. NPDC057488 TaxID=3346147 RepID=UPI00366BA71E
MLDVVRYWQAIEHFSPQQLESPGEKDGLRALSSNGPLPWQLSTREPTDDVPDDAVWRHTMYLGVFDLAKVGDTLRQVLGTADDEADDGRTKKPTGYSALASLTFDERGRYVKESLTVSGCAWAVGNAPSLLTGDVAWTGRLDEIQDTLEQMVAGIGDGLVTARPGTTSSAAKVAGITGWTLAFVSGGVSTIIPALVSAAAPWISSLAELAIEKFGGALADKANDTIRENVSRDQASDATPHRPTDIGIRSFTREDLAALTLWTATGLHVLDSLEPTRIWHRSYQVRPGVEPPATDMLGSFQADDLGRVASALDDRDAGQALLEYLTPHDQVDKADRTDLHASPRVLLDRLAPRFLPAGCWPGEHHLVASQQFALNQTFLDLAVTGARGLRTVNGPPGTGKTTLLKDVVAGVVVERARQLAKLPNARAAFAKKPLEWETKTGKTRAVYPPIPALTGYEMVVASSNNGAVENISRDLPARSAIDAERFADADYFAEQAELMTGDEDSWGAVAAVLGKKEYRDQFVKAHWIKGHEGDPRLGLHMRLKNAVRGDGQSVSWRDAVAAFDAASSRVEQLRSERQAVADNVVRPDEPVTTGETLDRAVAAARTRRDALERPLDDARRHAATAESHRSSADTALLGAIAAQDHHRSSRPGWLRRLFRPAEHRTWLDERARLAQSADRARGEQAEALADSTGLDAAVVAARSALTEATEELGSAERRAACLARASAAWGGAVPGADWDASRSDRPAMERREQSTPWTDPEFVQARAELFLAALDLHKSLLVETGGDVLRSLAAAMDVIGGNVPRNVPATHVLAAWQVFFLAVPLISTTFDSLPRMFDRIGREDLGWLIVDEAGQARPQHIVGALWRAQRALVVGDPLQIEPVVTVPLDVQTLLRKHFTVDAAWMPGRGSVQSIADRTTPFGTYLSGPEGEDVWVGMPLRVHRRCDDPMFTISNAVAYGGSMVHGVNRKKPAGLLTQNTWVDVPAGPDRWNPLEGEWVKALLRQIDQRGREEVDAGTRESWDLTKSVFVVSPYRTVAKALEKPLAPWLPIKDKKNKRIGTVHTTQGKEAEVVILVLGGSMEDLDRSVWAARSPNVVNVAVSRAKRQLAVVGDLGRWSKQHYFSVLAGHVRDEPGQIKRVDGSVRPSW